MIWRQHGELLLNLTPEEPAAAVLKHTNPCGAAIAPSLSEAYEKAFQADSMSAFGGIVALNQAIDSATATALTKTFLECVIAPACDAQAQEILAAKNLNCGFFYWRSMTQGLTEEVRTIAGGFLIQATDNFVEQPQDWKVVSDQQPTPTQVAELSFA